MAWRKLCLFVIGVLVLIAFAIAATPDDFEWPRRQCDCQKGK